MSSIQDVYLAKLNKLKKIISLDMDAIKESSESLDKRSKKMQLFVLLFSAIVTILLGLDINAGSKAAIILKNSAVIFSAVLTALNAWNTFANYTIRSSQERTTLNKLTMLWKDIDLHTTGVDSCTEEEYKEFKMNYDQIHEEYSQERSSGNEEDGGSTTESST